MVCTPEQLYELLEKSLSEARLAHSRRVGELAGELCVEHGLERQKGQLAGAAHDWARELPPERLRELGLRDGRGESPLESRYPVLLHGRAAAVGLREILGIEDPDILEAVACHVTGRPGMGRLARIVFAADYLEPGRGFVPEDVRREILSKDINRMTLRVLEQILEYLRFTQKPIAPPALELLEELRGS